MFTGYYVFLSRNAQWSRHRARCNNHMTPLQDILTYLNGCTVHKARLAKNNGVQVSYDPGKTSPQKIVAAFNNEDPETLLQSSGAKEAK